MENVRNRRNVDIISDKLRVEKLIAQPQFSLRILNGESILIERAKSKPMYVGFRTLELSKLIMA